MNMHVIDSHTEGEPTRVLIEGVPDLGGGTVAEQAKYFSQNYDHVRRALMLEPRGSDVLVGAFLVPPSHPTAQFGVVFVNNAGILGMCVHGTIGVIRTLKHLGRIDPSSEVILETNVGLVKACERPDSSITVENVASYRSATKVPVQLTDRTVHADIAWGGNWFALVEDHGEHLVPERIPELTAISTAIRTVMNTHGLHGDTGDPVDHIELFGAGNADAHSTSFVLCPGGAYDRSPCGTGTSAKIACLATDGMLKEGEEWIQESIIGSRFTARYHREGEHIIPEIRGRAWITADSHIHIDETDPFKYGI